MAGFLYDTGDYDEGPYGYLPSLVSATLAISLSLTASMTVAGGKLLAASLPVLISVTGGFTRVIFTAATIDVRFTFSGFIISGELWIPIPDEDSPWSSVPAGGEIWEPITPIQGSWNG